ncbi:hypothetical protein ACIBI8_37190 [Streptomyces sp. NPDC050529]|uniref:hypothetical protein n=1 Tax=Streptomyces sp. NPDC050529 TaxID=3365624 RepID=UPI0037B87D0C
MSDATPTTDRQAAVHAIHALKSPPPPGSQHYQAGWDTGLEAAIEAVQGAFEQPPAPARLVLGTTDQQPTTADRRERYRAAIRDTDGWVLDDGQHMVDAVMAVADAEQAALRAEAEGLDEALRGAITVSEKDGALLRTEVDRLRVDRDAVLREAADRMWALANRTTERGAGVLWAAEWLRRMADEAQQPETEAAKCTYCGGSGVDPEDEGDWVPGVHMHDPGSRGPCPKCNGTRTEPVAADQPDTETEAAK